MAYWLKLTSSISVFQTKILHFPCNCAGQNYTPTLLHKNLMVAWHNRCTNRCFCTEVHCCPLYPPSCNSNSSPLLHICTRTSGRPVSNPTPSLPVLHGIKTAPSLSILNIRHYDDGSEMKRKGQKLPRKYQNLLQPHHNPKSWTESICEKEGGRGKNHSNFPCLKKGQKIHLKGCSKLCVHTSVTNFSLEGKTTLSEPMCTGGMWPKAADFLVT